MKLKLSHETRENIVTFSASGIIVVLFFYILKYFSGFARIASVLKSTFMPFLTGGFIAFMLLPLRNRVENIWLYRANLKKEHKRFIAVAVCLIVFLAGIAIVLMLMLPQLIESSSTLVDNMGTYVDTIEELYHRINSSSQNSPVAEMIFDGLAAASQKASESFTSLLSGLLSYSVHFISGVFRFFVAVIISVYLLADSERFAAQTKDVIRAMFSPGRTKYIMHVGRLTRQMLNSFVFGKAIDSLIVGLICGVFTFLTRMPYALLLSFIIGLTNLIPVFGPFIGAIPSIFILLFISPWKALEFAVFILILQQIDGNIIGPRILGDSMGLPALWIMFAIMIGGGFFGVPGMFFGVPVFAVIYVLIKEKVHRTLKEKEKETLV
ncbi:MAG: AI-2E family transporter [Solobacterium sp.]|nr:AI-2E family transporter [Solobacterium sp.]